MSRDRLSLSALPFKGPVISASVQRSRVLFINRSYWPDSEATGQLLTQLCEGLTERFHVEVLCGQPNHVSGGITRSDQDQGMHQGVTIHRLRHTTFSKRFVAGRLVNLVSFTRRAHRMARRMAPPDVVITETDPFFLPLVGRAFQRRGSRFIAYLQDIYPDVAIAVGKVREGFLTKRIRHRLFECYRHADRVVVLSEDMRERCLSYGIAPERLEVLPNWTDTALIRPGVSPNRFRKRHQLGEQFVVMYSGNMGLAHELRPLLEAAALLVENECIQFLFIGDGVQRRELERDARARNLSNVRFLPYQPQEETGESLSAADLHVVSLKSGTEHCLFPCKLYGILAAQVPVLAICPSTSDLARQVKESDLGYIADTGQPEALAERIAFIIHYLADHRETAQAMGQRGRALAVEQFDRTVAIGRFRLLLETVLDTSVAEIAPEAHPLEVSSERPALRMED